jgi:hypothetical protein
MNSLLQLSRALPLLDHKDLRQFFLKFYINLLVASRFFLDRSSLTLLPPTLGIDYIIY